MKCGLDRNGVWAAWGKVCLAAGAWEEARKKFSYCLSPSPKPFRNPPLLDEICRILEFPTVCMSIKSSQKLIDKDGVFAEGNFSIYLISFNWIFFLFTVFSYYFILSMFYRSGSGFVYFKTAFSRKIDSTQSYFS